MDPSKSQEKQYKLFLAALLSSAQTLHSDVFTRRACTNTHRKMCRRIDSEGISFLTKTLPRLGKALDRALSSCDPIDCPYERKLKGTKLPRLLGELFSQVLSNDGRVLPTPCAACVRTLRQILFTFYKVKLPYTIVQEQDVIDQFIKAEDEVRVVSASLDHVNDLVKNPLDRVCSPLGVEQVKIIRRAKRLIAKLLQTFDYLDITPRHGPGAVSTKEKLWGKYFWTNIPDRIANIFPIDQYFYCNLDHVVDRTQEIKSLGGSESPAQVILVPKDSRGPRLISCEPLYNQWIQQGISRALVDHVERHPLTRCRVNFSNQQPNQIAALVGSQTGKYVTLDLKEASDRISCGLVRLLFPSHFSEMLESVRSRRTRLPNGRIINLEKHAPMGSALCFPILALSIWAILNAVAGNDTDTRERILVYGDDVIVPKAFASSAINQLTWFGLKLNLDKCCLDGFFRESCGMDAYLGVPVTPTRLRVPPTSTPRPEHYCAWISMANQFHKNGWFAMYDYIVAELERLYGPIPDKSMNIDSCPCIAELPVGSGSKHKVRYNPFLQKKEYYVRCIRTKTHWKNIDGWKMLLRYFTEKVSNPTSIPNPESSFNHRSGAFLPSLLCEEKVNTTVCEYTVRHRINFQWRWR